jgi:hypothetical protein
MGSSKYGNHMYASQMTPTVPLAKVGGLNALGRFVDNDIMLPADRPLNAHDSSSSYNPFGDSPFKRNYSEPHKDYKVQYIHTPLSHESFQPRFDHDYQASILKRDEGSTSNINSLYGEPAIEITPPTTFDQHHSYTEHSDKKNTIQFNQNQNAVQPRLEFKSNSNLTTGKDDSLRISPGNKTAGSPCLNPSNLAPNQLLNFTNADNSRLNNNNDGLRISPGIKTAGPVASPSTTSNQSLTFLNADGNRPSNNNRFKKKLVFTKDTTNP